MAAAAPSGTRVHVMSALGKLAEAYAGGDSDKLAGLYLSGAPVAFGPAVGEKWIGRKQIGAAYSREFKNFPDSNLQFLWASISAAGAVAWVAADCKAHIRIDNKILFVEGRFTAVLVRKNSRWYFAQTHFSFPSPF